VIYDANNGTRARRKLITDKFIKQGINVLFLGVFKIGGYEVD
jgi:hypothetical protein